MAGSQNLMMRMVKVFSIQVLIGSLVQSVPSPPSIPSSRGPPQLPQYYPSSSQRPPSVPPPHPSSSLAPTSPVYSVGRIRQSNSYGGDYDDSPYPIGSSSHLPGGNKPSLDVGNRDYEDAPENTGFVEPIDFGGLLKDIGSSPKVANLEVGNSQSNPLFASESKDNLQGFFGSTKNPFEELTRLNTASSSYNSRPSNGEEENVGFVDPNVQFRSLFDSAGSSSSGFGPSDFLGSKGSQTRAYPSYTYSGRGSGEDDEQDDYPRGGGGGRGDNRYRSSYRQVGGDDNSSNDYNHSPSTPHNQHAHTNPEYYETNRDGQYYDYDQPSNYSPQTDYDDRRGGGNSYSPSSNSRRATRYNAPQESASSPQSKPRASATESKNPRCKKVEKSVDYGEDHASFTEPDQEDYDPSTYQGRYKRQARQRSRQQQSNKRPMTCYVCEDEHGRYAEKCSYDSKASPNNNGNYYHSESSSFSDNGRRPSQGKGRHRRGNRQRYSTSGEKDDHSASESTTQQIHIRLKKTVAPEIAESEPKVINKRQSGGGHYHNYGGHGGRGSGGRSREHGDPYDASTGSYQHPSGYEGPPLGAIGDTSGNPNFYEGTGGHHGGQRGNSGFDEYNIGHAPNYEREANADISGYDFSIPREFDPDVQLRPGGGSGGSRRSGGHQTESSPQVSGPHGSASDRRERLDDFDIGYNDYVRQHFPEAFGSPGSGFAGNGPSFNTPSYSSNDYDFKPNYYHRPRQENNNERGQYNSDDRRQSPEVSYSNSPDRDYRRGYDRPHGHGHHGGGGGPRRPEGDHTQSRQNFSPPPGFFSEDNPAYENENENYSNLGNLVKEFSTRTRDGCRRVNKGDMTCFVCRDAKGGNKEECIYASNDPKNKAMAYHEVTEYSSPTFSFLPAPLHASLLGQPLQNTDSQSGHGGGLAAQASSLSITTSPTTATIIEDGGKSSSSTSVSVSARTQIIRKVTTTSPKSNKRKSPEIRYDDKVEETTLKVK